MAARAGLVSYDGLPMASGGAHGLGRMGARDAWAATLNFVGACTTGASPRRVTLAINSAEGGEPGLAERLTHSAVGVLGLHPSPHERREYGEQGGSLIWRLSPEQATAAVAWRESLGSLRTSWLGGPVRLQVDFRLRFRDAHGGEELPHQDSACYLGQEYDGYGVLLGESGCRLVLSSRSSLSVLFFLPFEAPGPELWEYAGFLQSRLPFAFSAKHWRHWRLTKKGASYVASRIKDPVLGPRSAA